MATSTILSPIELNAELQVAILHGTGGPDTDAPSAPIGSKYWNEASGDWWTRKASGWIQDGVASTGAADWGSITGKPTTRDGYAISDVYTKTESDARYWTQAQADVRYLALAGGTLTGNLTLVDVHAQRDATTGAVYFGSDGSHWLYRHDSVLDVQNMHLGLNDGFGLYNNAYGTQFKFATGGPGYMDFLSGDSTVAGIRVYASWLRGYLYANSAGIGLLNDQSNWSLRCNYGASYGGALFGTWTQDGVTLAKVVYSSAAPTSSDNYPDGTLWIVR